MSSAGLAPMAIVLSIPQGELERLCRLFGPLVKCQNAVDETGMPLVGERLLLAMAGRESSYGRNLKPRHEPAYDTGGFYWRRSETQRTAVAHYGAMAACSFGPLQVLACNAAGFTPYEMAGDAEKAMAAAVGFLNRHCFEHWKCRTIAAICDAWNTGNPTDKHVPLDYIRDVQRNYAIALDFPQGPAKETTDHA